MRLSLTYQETDIKSDSYKVVRVVICLYTNLACDVFK